MSINSRDCLTSKTNEDLKLTATKCAFVSVRDGNFLTDPSLK